ncbi:MAG: type II toxin-antitoxin system Phd/YefM family antitoxin [Candidatus Cyclonatronum sp.]|uniref:type II toxin-antitoxin system Phd/YefM family antitoxin n=1 Tax=Cyclonatronum sp. TaxID=3024185 RepID=UPI0025BA398D|nr:type II toxin-antitoxin system Phd/YefM family antitoxin [Cyclonatronum sp.]MCH8485855.1 type II toxin-antitoxin system Phd/YefM family antitoxin [Cyclonatronum sp.]
MKVYTYSQARQQLAQLLDDAREDGQAQIRRRDGQTFVIKPLEEKKSPLDVAGVSSDLSLDEINTFVREGRERA